jgi:hypothetical protein
MNIHRDTRAAAGRSNYGEAQSSGACGATSRSIQTPPPEPTVGVSQRGGAFSRLKGGVAAGRGGLWAGGSSAQQESSAQQGTSAQQGASAQQGNSSYARNSLPTTGYSPFQAGELSYSANSQPRYSPAQPIGHQPSAPPDPCGALQSLQISAAEVPARYKGFNFRRRPQPPVTKPSISAVGRNRPLQSLRFPPSAATARYKGANPPRRRFCNPTLEKRNSIHF